MGVNGFIKRGVVLSGSIVLKILRGSHFWFGILFLVKLFIDGGSRIKIFLIKILKCIIR